MGLDMYLYRKSDSAKNLKEARKMEDAFWKDAKWDDKADKFVSDVEAGFEEIGYWRKANMIHGWFERNCGADNCDYYPVSRKQLTDLMMTCDAVLGKSELVDGTICAGYRFENGKRMPIIEFGKVVKDSSFAEKHLPTCEGFFFGGTDYDEWYINDVRETVNIINSALNDYDDDEFYYYPSW